MPGKYKTILLEGGEIGSLKLAEERHYVSIKSLHKRDRNFYYSFWSDNVAFDKIVLRFYPHNPAERNIRISGAAASNNIAQ